MRRLLMVHYYFPPLGGIGSIRALKFARYLPEFDWSPTVIAPRAGSYYRDPTLSADAVRVIRTPSIEFSRIGKRLIAKGGGETRAADVGRLGGWIRERVRAWLYWPDAQIGWYPFALSAGRALLRRERFHAVHSSSGPITAHLIARRLAQEARLPWTAEFRDPWEAVRPTGDPRRERAQRLERQLLAAADAVVAVSPTLAALCQQGGARRPTVITNGFDPDDYSGAAAPQDFVVTHAGSYYPHMQDLGALWPALRELRDSKPGLRLRIRVVGDIHTELRRQIEASLADCLEVTGFVSYYDSLSHMESSSLLVVAGTPSPHPVYDCLLPAKLFEYLGTGRPLLYVGSPASDAGELLRRHPGCWLVPAREVGATLAALREVLAAPRRFDRDLVSYTRRSLAGRLAALLDGLCAQ